MKTLNINTNQKVNRMRGFSRFSMIMVGIATVLIGALTLLGEVQPVKNYENVNGIIGTSKTVVTDISLPIAMEIAPKVVASVLWPF